MIPDRTTNPTLFPSLNIKQAVISTRIFIIDYMHAEKFEKSPKHIILSLNKWNIHIGIWSGTQNTEKLGCMHVGHVDFFNLIKYCTI